MMNAMGSMSEEQLRAAKNEVWAMQLGRLRHHLPDMRASQAELAHSVGQLQVTEGTATRIYAWNALCSLAQMHKSAVLALDNSCDFSAQSLAQDAIQLAVNVAYVLDDPTGDRLSGALRNLLDTQRARFAAWQSAIPGDEGPGFQVERLALLCRSSPWYASAPAWPPVAMRADAVGLGAWVHSVLSATVDTEQAVSQELMNFLTCERGSPAERRAAHVYRTARCASDALYMEAVALRLFADALYRMASLLKDVVASTVAESAIEKMDAVIAAYIQLSEAHLNDTNMYMAVRWSEDV